MRLLLASINTYISASICQLIVGSVMPADALTVDTVALESIALVSLFPVSSFLSGWHYSGRKGQYALRPVSQQPPLPFPQCCPGNSANVGPVERRSLPTSEGHFLSQLPFPLGYQCCDAVVSLTHHGS